MAYVSFADAGTAATGEVTTRPVATQASSAAKPHLSALEWSVVAIARTDRLASLRTPGRIAIAMGALFGGRRDPRLADPRLEALRRIAVLSWHYGYTVPSHAVRDFLSAGFSASQYELLVDSIDVARAAAAHR
ncbi:hypothetical protein Q5H91_10645 [Sphingomonas sp. KR1UV-12]|uniref:Uncharacterized protein n=1 Tax=Sphingomonas aurea TaxID=3063994 RepID=A0ABT9ELL8_9SPHN|nr:hypothetical protein [Sphingomonas sp. KR1UV-12]MDP1027673.1 hypothetical protein [Sphingomonas sp. KR1UV-12]